MRVNLQWSGSTIEAVRRIQNTQNSIAVEYKVQLEIDGERYQSRCDVFPVYNTQFNLTTDSGYPFYCSCTKKGCQSKQCTFETNPSHQGLDYGNQGSAKKMSFWGEGETPKIEFLGGTLKRPKNEPNILLACFYAPAHGIICDP